MADTNTTFDYEKMSYQDLVNCAVKVMSQIQKV